MPKSPEVVGSDDNRGGLSPESSEVQIRVPKGAADAVRACVNALRANFGSGLKVDVEELERRLEARMRESDRLKQAQ